MILNRQRAVRVAQQPLELFLARVRRELGISEADVTICLVSDAEIARMNQVFRKKKGPTDVLSFPAMEHGKAAALPGKSARGTRRSRRGSRLRYFLGDIAISPSTARRNSKKLGRTLPSELQILILHGVLHLLGYDHETDRGEMDRVEERLRRKLELT
ncbi:MAG TPA: rRNA maturation RNase YbeY [Candidatus Acidoferrum sp.]|jgi:probable rRNA maturation factor